VYLEKLVPHMYGDYADASLAICAPAKWSW
jgi:hypothetical protein